MMQINKGQYGGSPIQESTKDLTPTQVEWFFMGLNIVAMIIISEHKIISTYDDGYFNFQ